MRPVTPSFRSSDRHLNEDLISSEYENSSIFRENYHNSLLDNEKKVVKEKVNKHISAIIFKRKLSPEVKSVCKILRINSSSLLPPM